MRLILNSGNKKVLQFMGQCNEIFDPPGFSFQTPRCHWHLCAKLRGVIDTAVSVSACSVIDTVELRFFSDIVDTTESKS